MPPVSSSSYGCRGWAVAWAAWAGGRWPRGEVLCKKGRVPPFLLTPDLLARASMYGGQCDLPRQPPGQRWYSQLLFFLSLTATSDSFACVDFPIHDFILILPLHCTSVKWNSVECAAPDAQAHGLAPHHRLRQRAASFDKLG
jgi:hypothetical protein